MRLKSTGGTRASLAEALLENHSRRQRNVGRGDWQLRVGRFVLIYDWPDHGDRSTARVITVWRQE
jgi:mRNA-degrading endonuclease RelE of RelBE toxin-antitoxin system